MVAKSHVYNSVWQLRADSFGRPSSRNRFIPSVSAASKARTYWPSDLSAVIDHVD